MQIKTVILLIATNIHLMAMNPEKEVKVTAETQESVHLAKIKELKAQTDKIEKAAKEAYESALESFDKAVNKLLDASLAIATLIREGYEVVGENAKECPGIPKKERYAGITPEMNLKPEEEYRWISPCYASNERYNVWRKAYSPIYFKEGLCPACYQYKTSCEGKFGDGPEVYRILKKMQDNHKDLTNLLRSIPYSIISKKFIHL